MKKRISSLFRQRRIVPLLLFLLLLAAPANAQNILREEIRVPMAEAGERGLQALFIRPNAPGRYPLAVFSHGAPRDTAERRRMSPYGSLPVAMEFVRRGWAVAIVMRRGYGTSGGTYSEGVACESDGNFTASGLTAAADIRAAFDFVSRRSDVDPNIMIAVGESAGGFSSLALASVPPRGLVAAISFAGGRGSTGPFQICQQNKLVEAFANYGKTSRIPTLWIYAQNDTFFEPKVAQQFFDAFRSTGGIAEFIAQPRHGEDGHNFVYRGIDIWTAYVDDFLRKHKLPRSRELLEIKVANIPPPPRLSTSGLRSFQDFLRHGPNKAFAVAPDGAYGWRAGVATREDAIKDALDNCDKHARGCEIYVVNDEIVRDKPRPQTQRQAQTTSLPPPPRLSNEGKQHFENFLRAPANKAFAVASDGAFGWQSGMNTRDEAIARALERCSEHARDCRIYIVNNELTRGETPRPQSRNNSIPPPPKLSSDGLRDFENFLQAREHKAFAVTPDGAYGWRTGAPSREEAIQSALATCEKYGRGCRLYLVNNELVTQAAPPAGRTIPAAPGSSQ